MVCMYYLLLNLFQNFRYGFFGNKFFVSKEEFLICKI